MSSERARVYFEFIADLGMTKHYGSMAATRELIELCRIGSGQYVLDVGCGVGATPCYLAKAIGCRVVGVDLVAKMIEQSRERAKAEGVEDQVEFIHKHRHDLPSHLQRPEVEQEETEGLTNKDYFYDLDD